MLPGESLLQGVGLDVLDPLLHGVGTAQDLADLLVSEKRGSLEVVLRDLQVVLGTLAADRLGRAPAAPVAAGHVVGALQRHDGTGRDVFLSPEQELGERDLLGADVIQAGLDDRVADRLEVVEVAEEGRSAQAVEPQLSVVLGVHFDALAILQVDDLDCAAADHDGVAGSEGLRHPLVEAEVLLDHELRVGSGSGQVLDDRVRVEVGGLVHLAAPVLTLLELGQFLVVLLRGDLPDVSPQLQLGDRVGQGALVSVGTGARRRELGREGDGAGAVDPPLRAARRQLGMFTRH